MKEILLLIFFALASEITFRIRYKDKRGMDQNLMQLIGAAVLYIALIITIFS